jgi:hypothetical protein
MIKQLNRLLIPPGNLPNLIIFGLIAGCVSLSGVGFKVRTPRYAQEMIRATRDAVFMAEKDCILHFEKHPY